MAHEPKVASFAPELLALYREANDRAIEVKLESKEAAHRLQFRMHQLRKALRRELHELAPVAEGCMVKMFEREGTWIVLVEPADSTLLDAINAAGVSVDPEDQEMARKHETELSHDALDHFLDSKDEDD